MRRLTPFLLGLFVSGSASAMTPDAFLLMTSQRVSGPELARRVEEASRHPLGSRLNPVRVLNPNGERAYLARLRCSDGRVPAFFRAGSFGAGPYGSIVDGYRVSCPSQPTRPEPVFLDMYHPDHVERHPVPGFTIVP